MRDGTWEVQGKNISSSTGLMKITVQRKITKLCGPTSKQHRTLHVYPVQIDCVYCSYKYCPLQGQQVVGAFKCDLLHALLPSVPSPRWFADIHMQNTFKSTHL